jgi:hypothetical protein
MDTVKILASIVIVVLLLCGGALWFLAGGSLNEFVKQQIETIGSDVTGQTVSVATVDIKLTQGAGSILGLNLTNPEQYKQPQALALGEVTLDINLKSLTKSPIIIDAIIIRDPKFFAEITSDGNSNIQDLIAAIDKSTKTQATATTETADGGEETKLSVSKIVLEGTELMVDLSALGNKAHSVVIPSIHLRGVGGKEGLPASQLGSAIAKQALSELWSEAKKVQKDKLVDEAKQTIKDKVQKKLTDLFK